MSDSSYKKMRIEYHDIDNLITKYGTNIKRCDVIDNNLQKKISSLGRAYIKGQDKQQLLLSDNFYNELDDIITHFEQIPDDKIKCVANDDTCALYKSLNKLDKKQLDINYSILLKYKNIIARINNVLTKSNEKLALQCGLDPDIYIKLRNIYNILVTSIVGKQNFVERVKDYKYVHITYLLIICCLIIIFISIIIFRK